MKKCSKCLKTKPVDCFSKEKTNSDGRRSSCRKCEVKRYAQYDRSKHGLTVRIYNTQKRNSRTKGFPVPKYNRKELKEWLFSQPVFHDLYDNWVKSNYDTWSRPSCDRIDDYKGYSLDNIQLMTWRQNLNKSHRDRINGVNNKTNKSVKQYSLYGVFLQKFHSLTEAHRVTGVHRGDIGTCCRGGLKTAGGFVWEYSKD